MTKLNIFDPSIFSKASMSAAAANSGKEVYEDDGLKKPNRHHQSKWSMESVGFQSAHQSIDNTLSKDIIAKEKRFRSRYGFLYRGVIPRYFIARILAYFSSYLLAIDSAFLATFINVNLAFAFVIFWIETIWFVNYWPFLV